MGKGKRTFSSDVDSEQESDLPKSKKAKNSKIGKSAFPSAGKGGDDQLYWDVSPPLLSLTPLDHSG
jgi:hypothetical protein